MIAAGACGSVCVSKFIGELKVTKDAFRAAGIMLIIVALSASSEALELELPKTPLELDINSGGRRVESCTIAPDSSRFNRLALLIAAHRDEWEPTPATYVPNVVVTGPDFSINFLREFVVISYAAGQFERPIAASEYDFLSCSSKE